MKKADLILRVALFVLVSTIIWDVTWYVTGSRRIKRDIAIQESENRELEHRNAELRRILDASLVMGDKCSCDAEGQDIGIGKCLDGVAVSKEAFNKVRCDRLWKYTQCLPDPRDFTQCDNVTDAGAKAQ